MVSVTVERLATPRGELVLRRDGEHHEIVSNGVFLMDTRDGRWSGSWSGPPCPARCLYGRRRR